MSGFRVRPQAEADIAEAFGWYSARSDGLGLEFLRAIDQSVAEIVRRPLTFPVVYRHVRRTLVRRFPYAVYFVAGAETVDILARTHQAAARPTMAATRLTPNDAVVHPGCIAPPTRPCWACGCQARTLPCRNFDGLSGPRSMLTEVPCPEADST